MTKYSKLLSFAGKFGKIIDFSFFSSSNRKLLFLMYSVAYFIDVEESNKSHSEFLLFIAVHFCYGEGSTEIYAWSQSMKTFQNLSLFFISLQHLLESLFFSYRDAHYNSLVILEIKRPNLTNWRFDYWCCLIFNGKF